MPTIPEEYKQRCCTKLNIEGSGKKSSLQCGLPLVDKNGDGEGGTVIKRGIVKITPIGVFVICPNCKRTTEINSQIVKIMLADLQSYSEKFLDKL